MVSIERFSIGDEVVTCERPHLVVRIISMSGSSVTVEGAKVGRTTWACATQVRRYVPSPTESTELPDTPSPSESGSADKQTVPKAKQAETDAPKPKGNDVFGVRMGSAAASVNAYLLSTRHNVTIAMILKNVTGTKKDNVKSHLRRMVKDGLLTDTSSDPKEPVVTVPPQYYGESNGKSRRDPAKTAKPAESDERERSKRSGSGNRNEARPKVDGKAQRRNG